MPYSKLIVSVLVGMSLTVDIGSAADLGGQPYSKSPVYVQPGYDWTGPYIGANVGYSWGRSSDTSTLNPGAEPALFTNTSSSKMDGVVGGAQMGYNWQLQNWLLGGEADFQGTGQRGTHSYVCPAGVCTGLVSGFPPVLLPGPALPVSLT